MSGCSGRASARCFGHAGEILQGVLPGHDSTSPFLITLPAPVYWSEATVVLRSRRLRPRSTKSFRAAALASAQWLSGAPVAVEVHSNIPLGRGAGSSTADCVAAVRATARLAGLDPSPAEVARLVLRAEQASDPLMYPPVPLAFLSRRGHLLQSFDWDWPEMHVAVFDLGGLPRPTLTTPLPAYSPAECLEFEHLLAAFRSALAAGNAAAVGAIASRSAAMLDTHQPDVAWQQLHAHALRRGAFGVARAHTGTLAAVLSPQPWPEPCLASYQLPFTRSFHSCQSF